MILNEGLSGLLPDRLHDIHGNPIDLSRTGLATGVSDVHPSRHGIHPPDGGSSLRGGSVNRIMTGAKMVHI